jgi:hypothetical protein
MQSGDETDPSPEVEDKVEGDDVPRRDPDAIADEIEQTRAELADTIDAIAERMNPKRAAARSANAVKAQVSSARDKVADVTTGNGVSGESPLRQAASAPVPVVPLAALAGLIALILLIVRRRHSR